MRRTIKRCSPKFLLSSMKIVFFYFFALNFSSIFFNKCSGDLIAVETGKKLGWSVKIETQGSGGIEFALTDQDIQEADCVLLATDVAVSGTERFKGKPVVKVPVSTAIKSPEHLLKKIEEKLSAKK
mgnify:CR=1 FL=1